MTKAELKKEAIQYAVDYPTSYGKGYKHKDLRIAYLAGAESREKRITELIALINAERKRQEECDDVHLRKIKDLEAELTKRAEQIEALNKDKDYFSDALDKQIEATYKVVEKLNKAKEIFQEYIRINLLPPIERNFDDEVKLFKQAEQFLKEETEQTCSNCKHYAKNYELCCYSLGDEDYDCRGRKWEMKEND